MISDENSRLKKLNSELYTTDIQPPNKRAILHETRVTAPEEWMAKKTEDPFASTMPSPKKPTSIFRNIFLASLAFLVVAVIILASSFLFGDNAISADNVQIAITAKSFVDGGENLPVDVSILNKNKLPLELATLVLEYPEGSTDNPNAVTRISRDIGTLAAGDTHDESFNLQLYGTQNSQKTITAHIEFRVQGSNAVYDKDEPTIVTIRTSPVNLTLKAPDQATPNQDIPLQFSIVGNGTATLPNTALIVQYPDGFTFTKADPSPSSGTNVWYLGDLPPGANRTITVHGTIAGGANDLKTIRASVGAQNQGNEQVLDTTYNTLAQVIPLSNAFLAASISLAGAQGTGDTIPVSAGQRISISVPWKNTLSVPLTNAQITVKLSGSAYDPSKVEPLTGFFDTSNDQIVWNKDQDSSLASINAGDTGSLSFSLSTKDFSSGTVTNPSIILSIDVIGYQSGTKLSAIGVDKKTFVVNSDLNLLASTVHYSGTITNTGPMPPVANKETTYTLDWQIVNLRNRVSGVTVSTTLPLYVAWKNVVVPQSESPNVTYNDVTRQLTWNVGEVPAGTGGSLPAKQLMLKVGITPSTSQNGSAPDLTGTITVTGHDGFTNQDLTFTKRPLTTQLLNDGTGPGILGQVGGH